MVSDKNSTNKETRSFLAGSGGVSLDVARGEKRKRGRGGGGVRRGASNVRVAPRAVLCHRNLDESCRRRRVYRLAGTTAADGEKETGGLERQREE